MFGNVKMDYKKVGTMSPPLLQRHYYLNRKFGKYSSLKYHSARRIKDGVLSVYLRRATNFLLKLYKNPNNKIKIIGDKTAENLR